MKQRSSGFIFGIVASIILGFGLFTLIVLGLRSDVGLGSESGVFQATKAPGSNGATLVLSTFPDSHVCHADAGAPQVNWVTYCAGDKGLNGLATQIQVPPNTDITVTIYQYDSGTPLINDYFRQVRGTIGGATLNGQPFSNVSDVAAISKITKGNTYASDPGHTFTIQSTPNSPDPLFVSVPLIGVNSSAPTNVNINGNMYPTPNAISFKFHSGPVGTTYLWHCYDPCGDTQYARNAPFGFSGPMWTLGYMAGMITVTNY